MLFAFSDLPLFSFVSSAVYSFPPSIRVISSLYWFVFQTIKAILNFSPSRMNIFKSHTLSLTGLLLLFCLSLSLVWCSDDTCQDGDADNCICLLCAMSKATDSGSATSDSHHGNSCSCVCQMSFISGSRLDRFFSLHPRPLASGPPFELLVGTTSGILKPPILRASSTVFNKPSSQLLIPEKISCSEYSLLYHPSS